MMVLWFLVHWLGRSQCRWVPGPPSTLLARFRHLDSQLSRGRNLVHPLARLADRLTNTCSLRQSRLMPARQLDPHRGVVLRKAKSRTLQPLHTPAQIVRGALDPGQTSHEQAIRRIKLLHPLRESREAIRRVSLPAALPHVAITNSLSHAPSNPARHAKPTSTHDQRREGNQSHADATSHSATSPSTKRSMSPRAQGQAPARVAGHAPATCPP